MLAKLSVGGRRRCRSLAIPNRPVDPLRDDDDVDDGDDDDDDGGGASAEDRHGGGDGFHASLLLLPVPLLVPRLLLPLLLLPPLRLTTIIRHEARRMDVMLPKGDDNKVNETRYAALNSRINRDRTTEAAIARVAGHGFTSGLANWRLAICPFSQRLLAGWWPVARAGASWFLVLALAARGVRRSADTAGFLFSFLLRDFLLHSFFRFFSNGWLLGRSHFFSNSRLLFYVLRNNQASK